MHPVNPSLRRTATGGQYWMPLEPVPPQAFVAPCPWDLLALGLADREATRRLADDTIVLVVHRLVLRGWTGERRRGSVGHQAPGEIGHRSGHRRGGIGG